MSSWKIYSGVQYYFCTVSISKFCHVFTDYQYFDVIIDSLKYCRKNKGLNIHAYVIMTNHLHLILSTEADKYLPDIIRDFKRHTSKEISSLLIERHQKNILRIFQNAALAKEINISKFGRQDFILLDCRLKTFSCKS